MVRSTYFSWILHPPYPRHSSSAWQAKTHSSQARRVVRIIRARATRLPLTYHAPVFSHLTWPITTFPPQSTSFLIIVNRHRCRVRTRTRTGRRRRRPRRSPGLDRHPHTRFDQGNRCTRDHRRVRPRRSRWRALALRPCTAGRTGQPDRHPRELRRHPASRTRGRLCRAGLG
jgi:hypothetical protein